MSRRDTIIVAVLVNAALLMVLFATAVRSDDPAQLVENKKVKPPKATELAKKVPAPIEKPKVEKSKVDDFLNEYVSTTPSQTDNVTEENLFSYEESALAYTAPIKTPSPVVEEPKITKAPSKSDEFVSVTVKKGDFLDKIARANNTTVAAIMEANHLASSQLKIGQVLKVPLNDKPKSTTAPSSTLASDAEYYTVKEGDNPWMIATRNKIGLDELLRLNGLDEQRAKRLRPGDKLKIR